MKRRPPQGGVHAAMVRCGGCGLLIANPLAGQDDLTHFYSNYYSLQHPEYLTDAGPEEARRESRWALHSEAMKRRFKNGKVLDIGCGPGLFLDLFHPEFDCHGFDPSEESVAVARKKGLNVNFGVADELDMPPESYDVILLWHVIEHLLDFPLVLRKINLALKQGGILIVGTENYANLKNYIWRSMDLVRGRLPDMRTASEHTCLFDSRSMHYALNNAGFTVEKMELYWSGRFSFPGFPGDAMSVVAAKR